jgi:hypothetical protein
MKLNKEQTDQIYYVITANGCRDMDEVRFHQAVNEALMIAEGYLVCNHNWVNSCVYKNAKVCSKCNKIR